MATRQDTEKIAEAARRAQKAREDVEDRLAQTAALLAIDPDSDTAVATPVDEEQPIQKVVAAYDFLKAEDELGSPISLT